MARKYEINEGIFCWNFELCEEVVLISSYEEIKAFIPPDSKWKGDFENHFYRHGNGVAVSYVDEINAARRRKNLDRVEFVETDVFDYGRLNDKLRKSETRQRLKDELAAATPDARLKRVERALGEMAALPPPHHTYDEYKARRRQWGVDAAQSHAEVTRRLAAVERSKQAASKASGLPIDKALKMLTFATDPDLRAGIIERMAPDDALEAVEKIENTGIRDALIRHFLKAA